MARFDVTRRLALYKGNTVSTAPTTTAPMLAGLTLDDEEMLVAHYI